MKKSTYQRKEAIALRYDEQKHVSPEIIAKGKGLIAEQILQLAETHEVPVYEDPSLITLLDELNVNDKIPEDLYSAVAEVFAFIYRVDQRIE
ncbi:EscU/YscU/HrcU family type III secretion system export apparatus switch protein [Bacillaceae bacterium W0354]